MSSLFDRIQSDLTRAIKGGEKERVGALRYVIAQIQYARKEKQAELTDEDVLEVLTRQARGRRESIEAFTSGERSDLVEKESFELAIIETYLPEQLGADEIREVLQAIIAEEGLTGPAGMGQLMKAGMARLHGRADGKLVSELAREELQRIAD